LFSELLEKGLLTTGGSGIGGDVAAVIVPSAGHHTKNREIVAQFLSKSSPTCGTFSSVWLTLADVVI